MAGGRLPDRSPERQSVRELYLIGIRVLAWIVRWKLDVQSVVLLFEGESTRRTKQSYRPNRLPSGHSTQRLDHRLAIRRPAHLDRIESLTFGGETKIGGSVIARRR